MYYYPSRLSSYGVHNLSYYSDLEKAIMQLLGVVPEKIFSRTELSKGLNVDKSALYKVMKKLYARGQIEVYDIYRIPKKRTDPQYESGFRFKCHKVTPENNIKFHLGISDLEEAAC